VFKLATYCIQVNVINLIDYYAEMYLWQYKTKVRHC